MFTIYVTCLHGTNHEFVIYGRGDVTAGWSWMAHINDELQSAVEPHVERLPAISPGFLCRFVHIHG
jgi:hypothetical protein